MRSIRTVLMVACCAVVLGGPLQAASPFAAGPERRARVDVPTSHGSFRSEVAGLRSGSGVKATFALDGRSDILEVTATPSNPDLGYAQLDVRFGGLGSIRYALTSNGLVPLEVDIRDCAAIAELPVMQAAIEAARSALERLARPEASADPDATALASAATFLTVAAIAPALLPECREVAGRMIPWGCPEESWEEDCQACCLGGRRVTDLGSVFCGALGASLCAPSVAGAGLCAGIAGMTCKLIGEFAEAQCRESCAPLPRRPGAGKKCGNVEGAVCADYCEGLIVSGACGPGLVCCLEDSSSLSSTR